MEEKCNIKDGFHNKNNPKTLANNCKANPNNVNKNKDAYTIQNHTVLKLSKTLREINSSEEIVWHFNPDEKLSTNKTASTVELPHNTDRIDNNLRNSSSSTFLFNNWLEGILDFNNMFGYNQELNVRKQLQVPKVKKKKRLKDGIKKDSK